MQYYRNEIYSPGFAVAVVLSVDGALAGFPNSPSHASFTFPKKEVPGHDVISKTGVRRR